eukprot:120001_1
MGRIISVYITLTLLLVPILCIPVSHLDYHGKPLWFRTSISDCSMCFYFKQKCKNGKKQYEASLAEDDRRELFWAKNYWTCFKESYNTHKNGYWHYDLFKSHWLLWSVNVTGAEGDYIYDQQYNKRTSGNVAIFYNVSDSKWIVPDSLGGNKTFATCDKSNFFECSFVSTGLNCPSM